MSAFEPYRVFTDLDGLREALVDRIEDLNISRPTVDEAAQLTPGYAAKLLCDPPMKQLANGTIPKLLKATGMVLVAVIDDERFAQIKDQLMARKHKVRRVGRLIRMKGPITKENAAKYNKARWENVTPEMRKKFMRKIAKAGWRTRRAQARHAAASGMTISACAAPEKT